MPKPAATRARAHPDRPTHPAHRGHGGPGTSRAAALAAALPCLLGVLTLASWTLDVPVLRGKTEAGHGMLPVTAVALLLLGCALAAVVALHARTPGADAPDAPDAGGARDDARRLVAVAVGATALVGALAVGTLVSDLFGTALWTDRLLFPTAVAAPDEPRPVGRMAAASALGLLLLVPALLVLAATARTPRLRRWQVAAIVGPVTPVVAVAFVAVVGFLYDLPASFLVPPGARAALPAALAILSLGLGVLLVRPGAGFASLLGGADAGAVLARTLIPAAVLVPVLLGLGRVVGDRLGLFPPRFGTVLRTLAEVLVLLVVTVVTARRLAALDAARSAALAAESRARHDAEAARVEAEAANRARSDFLASMSHELRTPLNAIQGYVQLLDMGVHGPVTEEQQRVLGRVAHAQARLLALVNDALNFARLEAGRVSFELGAVPLEEVVHEVLPLVEPQAAARGLVLTTALADAPTLVWADRAKLGQVLLNLLSNAIKFTPRTRDDGTPGRVHVAVSLPADRPGAAELSVCDTGIGIPAARRAAVFEPFVQVSTGLTRTVEGTGLGLAISRDLVHGMRGRLTLQSVEGEGSTFTVQLRRVGAAGEAPPERRRRIERRQPDRRGDADRRGVPRGSA